MNIKNTFLKLTSKTYPHGTEHLLEKFLPKGFSLDSHGNYYYIIGESKTIFAAHLDTVSKKHEKVKTVEKKDKWGNRFIHTDGPTTLGADDKAGVCVLLYMMEKQVPGTYYFFIGEEVGCIGSKAAARADDFYKYDRIISFDRRDTCSIITHQSWERCCSDDFANALSKEYGEYGLELKPDDGGVSTDSAQFMDIVPECTNISVGYYNEHTFNEYQNIDFLEKLCFASALVNWEDLPTKRDYKVKEYKDYYEDHGYWNNRNWNRQSRWNWGEEDEDLREAYKDEYDKIYGYSNYKTYDDYDDDEDFETPIDNTFESNLRNINRGDSRKRDKYTHLSKDMFILYRDFLEEPFKPSDWNTVDELYLNFISA